MLLREGKVPTGHGTLVSCDWARTLLLYILSCTFIVHLYFMVYKPSTTNPQLVASMWVHLVYVYYLFYIILALSHAIVLYLSFWFSSFGKCLLAQRKHLLRINHLWLLSLLAMSMWLNISQFPHLWNGSVFNCPTEWGVLNHIKIC